MDLLALLASRTVVAQLVGFIFAFLATFGIVLPSRFDQASVVGAALLILAAATSVARFSLGVPHIDGAKHWYESKTIWTQIVAAAFAVFVMFGWVPAGVDQAQVVGGIMMAVAAVNVLLHRSASAAIL